jgi:hypothetical protein
MDIPASYRVTPGLGVVNPKIPQAVEAESPSWGRRSVMPSSFLRGH